MNKEIYSFAMKNALNEIREINKSIKCSFIFNSEREIIAEDEKSSKYDIKSIMENLEEIFEKIDVIGGLNYLEVKGKNGTFKIFNLNEDSYLALTVEEDANTQLIETTVRVILPTLLRLLEKLAPTHLTPAPKKQEEKIVEEELNENKMEIEEKEKTEPELELESEPIEPEIPVNQLIVDTIGGLLVRSDTVHIDASIISQWNETLDGKDIEMVEIETFDGKTVQCKVKEIKDSKLSGKGIIKIPEKLCKNLEIKRGELVRVKPVIS